MYIDCRIDIEAETADKEKPLRLAENDSMALLLVANGVNIDSQDKFGTTRLHAAFASDRGDPQLRNAVVKLLARLKRRKHRDTHNFPPNIPTSGSGIKDGSVRWQNAPSSADRSWR